MHYFWGGGAWQACLKILSGSARLRLWMINSQGHFWSWRCFSWKEKIIKLPGKKIQLLSDCPTFKLLFKLCSHLHLLVCSSRWRRSFQGLFSTSVHCHERRHPFVYWFEYRFVYFKCVLYIFNVITHGYLDICFIFLRKISCSETA